MKVEDIKAGKTYYGSPASHTYRLKVNEIFEGVIDYIDGHSENTGIMYVDVDEWCKCDHGAIPEQWRLNDIAAWAVGEVENESVQEEA